MLQAIKQHILVSEPGKIEITAPELSKGKIVEVIVFIDSEPDTTDYLLATPANREHLDKALQDLKNKESYVYIDVDRL